MQHGTSSTCLDISDKKFQTTQIHSMELHIYHSHPHMHTLSIINVILNFNTDACGALGMPGHRWLFTASCGGGNQKYRQKRRASSQCVDRIKPEVSTGQHTGVAHSPNNKENKQQDSTPQLQSSRNAYKNCCQDSRIFSGVCVGITKILDLVLQLKRNGSRFQSCPLYTEVSRHAYRANPPPRCFTKGARLAWGESMLTLLLAASRGCVRGELNSPHHLCKRPEVALGV